jgi:hypothetical protein
MFISCTFFTRGFVPEKSLLTSSGYLAAFLLFSFAFSACKDKNGEIEGLQTRYALSTVAGAYPSQTTYIQGLSDLNSTTIDNSKAAEMADYASMWNYKKAVYMTKFGAPATMTKFTFNGAGVPKEAGKLVVPGANTFTSIHFINDTLAYGSLGGGLARVVRFNPTAYQITGEVNLTPIQKAGATSVFYLGMIDRGNKLFMGVQYFGIPAADSAYVAVIDIPTGRVEKLLGSEKTSMIFAAGSAINGFVKDANDDIYVMGMGSRNVPSGVLRIKKDQTELDPSYFFNLNTATGKNCYSLYHFGNGLTFTTRIEDMANFWSAPVCSFYRLDLANKTSLGALEGVPLVNGSSSSLMRQFNTDAILFSVAAANENAIYEYSLSTQRATKKMTLTGMCTGFTQLK